MEADGTPVASSGLDKEMRICLFDIDGTLINTRGAGRAAFESALLSRFRLRAIAREVATSGRTDRAIAADLFGAHGIADSPENWEAFRAVYLEHLGPSLSRRRGTVLPGVAALLESLGGRAELRLGLLTGNIREAARMKLGFFGLLDHFNLPGLGGFGDQHADRDSVARDALAAARGAVDPGLSAEDVWVVGDTPLDVECARAIGARAVAVATGIHSRRELEASRPDLLLADLRDPLALVEQLS